MIVLLLGTNPYPFARLLDAVDRWAAVSGERVVAQTGHTPARAGHVECQAFVPHERIVSWLRGADVAVTQGGFGSIRDCLLERVATVAVPRRVELGECQDEQVELVTALEQEGWLVAAYDVERLEEAIERARGWVLPRERASRVPEIVRDAVLEVMSPER